VLRGVDSRRSHGLGQSLVEFALFAPLFALLILGAADLARLFYYNVAITNMAREAARHGAYFDPSTGTPQFANNSAILATVRAEDMYISGSTVAEPIAPGTSGACPGSASHHMPSYASSLWPTQVNSANVYICFNDTDASTTSAPGQPIRVTVLYRFEPMAPVIWQFLGNNGDFLLTGTAEFTTEGL
jgi:Flp pilus assembly protein TadG